MWCRSITVRTSICMLSKFIKSICFHQTPLFADYLHNMDAKKKLAPPKNILLGKLTQPRLLRMLAMHAVRELLL